jgi:capsule polysaccharide export protein KpsE/RkpR
MPFSTILVNEDPTNHVLSSLLFPAAASRSGISFSNFSYGELAVKLLTSKTVLFTIVEEFKVAERYHITKGKLLWSRDALIKRLGISYDDKTMILTVSFKDYDAKFASSLINRLVGELGAKFNTLDVVRNAGQGEVLESKIAEVRNTIEALEADIKKFQKKYGFLEVQTLADEQTTTVAEVRVKLMNKEIEIKTKQALLNKDDPELKNLFAERDSLVNLIDELESGFTTYENTMPSQKDLPDVAQQFTHLQRELGVQEKIFDILIQQNELAKLSLAGFSPLFQVIDIAEVPDVKAGPGRSVVCMIGAVISLISGIVLAVLFSLIKNMIPRIIGKDNAER